MRARLCGPDGDGAAPTGDAPSAPAGDRRGDRAPGRGLRVVHARVARPRTGLARPLPRSRSAPALRVPAADAADAHVAPGPPPVGAEVSATPVSYTHLTLPTIYSV